MAGGRARAARLEVSHVRCSNTGYRRSALDACGTFSPYFRHRATFHLLNETVSSFFFLQTARDLASQPRILRRDAAREPGGFPEKIAEFCDVKGVFLDVMIESTDSDGVVLWFDLLSWMHSPGWEGKVSALYNTHLMG